MPAGITAQSIRGSSGALSLQQLSNCLEIPRTAVSETDVVEKSVLDREFYLAGETPLGV